MKIEVIYLSEKVQLDYLVKIVQHWALGANTVTVRLIKLTDPQSLNVKKTLNVHK